MMKRLTAVFLGVMIAMMLVPSLVVPASAEVQSDVWARQYGGYLFVAVIVATGGPGLDFTLTVNRGGAVSVVKPDFVNKSSNDDGTVSWYIKKYGKVVSAGDTVEASVHEISATAVSATSEASAFCSKIGLRDVICQ